jgi:hypothetical protein
MTPTQAPFQPHALRLKLRGGFHSRRTEWTAGAQSLIWGLVLLAPGDVFNSSPAFAFLRNHISEDVMGWIMIAVGIIRFIGLRINGSRKKITPWIRVAMALVGCGVFTLISLSFEATGVWSTWLAAWPVLAVTELFNVYAAISEARQARDG